MAFTVQDDNGGVANANAYLTVAEFKTYHDDRAQSYGAVSDPVIEGAIVRATTYLDSRFRFVGDKVQGRDQTTAWPRSSAYDRDNDLVTGIPREVKNATAEYALRALTATGGLNPDPQRDATGAAVTMRKDVVGPIEETREYSAGTAFQMPKYPAADQWLRAVGLTRSGGEVRRG